VIAAAEIAARVSAFRNEDRVRRRNHCRRCNSPLCPTTKAWTRSPGKSR
jgi:RNase P subunit RPR2